MLGIFSMPEPVVFKPGFLWGSATAGHQIEGNNCNSQKYREELEQKFEEPSGMACNSWELYEQDVEMLVSLGHRAFRMSIEWSRIEPEPGRRDEAALVRYLRVLELLKEKKIRVFLTLHHFTHPLWFEKLGGFAKRENIDRFIRHLDFLVPRVAPYVDSWNVINEFNGSRSLAGNEMKVNFLVAHARGAAVIRQYSDAPVSTAHALVEWQPQFPEDDFDVTQARLVDWITNRFFFHAIRTGEVVLPFRDVETVPGLKDSCDYWALNYYTRHFISARSGNCAAGRHDCNHIRMLPRPFYLEEFYPEGVILQLDRLRDRPVVITENGLSCDDDRLRILYIARHLQALAEAERRGARIDGYFYWSLMDNYEWNSFVPRFGLVSVDFKTFRRTPKPSASFYREVIERNGFDRELVLKYLPEFQDWLIYR